MATNTEHNKCIQQHNKHAQHAHPKLLVERTQTTMSIDTKGEHCLVSKGTKGGPSKQ